MKKAQHFSLENGFGGRGGTCKLDNKLVAEES